MADEPDDLDDRLGPLQGADTPGLREAIFRRTRRRLALRRWTRRAGKVAAVAAVFAAGIGVGVWRTSGERETVLMPVPQVEVVFVPVLVPVPAPSPEPPPAPEAARTARAMELDAEQADDAGRAAALYREAGDRYLTAEQDYANAARCYRLFLLRSGDTALSPEPGDSWLLTSLKNAAFKEKIHATATNG